MKTLDIMEVASYLVFFLMLVFIAVKPVMAKDATPSTISEKSVESAK